MPNKRAERFDRIKRLRGMKAPLWIIRSEQVALVLLRRGIRVRGIGSQFSQAQHVLYAKFVTPLMGGE